MRPIGGFAHLMASTVQVAPRTSVDTYGKPVYGADVQYQCHVAKGTRLVPTAQAQEIVDAIQIYLNSAVAVLPSARITMTTGDVGSTESFDRQPRLLAVERRFDNKGAHHTVLYAGWAPRSV